MKAKHTGRESCMKVAGHCVFEWVIGPQVNDPPLYAVVSDTCVVTKRSTRIVIVGYFAHSVIATNSLPSQCCSPTSDVGLSVVYYNYVL